MNVPTKPFRTYDEWEESVPPTLKRGGLWTMRAYRLSLFLNDLNERDCARLRTHNNPYRSIEQLRSAVGSVGANIAEGYGRSSPKERSHFFDIALGSARESTHWYYQMRGPLGMDVVQHRLAQLDEIVSMLVVIVRAARSDDIR